MLGYPHYVETFREDGKAHVRAHLIPNGRQFDFEKLSPNITALFYVHRAKNGHMAIALVVESAAGKDNMVNNVTMADLNRAIESQRLNRSTVKRSTT